MAANDATRPTGLRHAGAETLLAAFHVDAHEFLEQFSLGLQPQSSRDDTLQALGNAAEALRGIRIGADFLRLDAVSGLCRRGEQDLLQQLPLVGSGAPLQWGTLQDVIRGLQQSIAALGVPAATESAPPEPQADLPLAADVAAAGAQPSEPEAKGVEAAPHHCADSTAPPVGVQDTSGETTDEGDAGQAPAPSGMDAMAPDEEWAVVSPPAPPDPSPAPVDPRLLTVLTASVGPWTVAVPAESSILPLPPDTPVWLGPAGQQLVLSDDGAVPALDLLDCWIPPDGRPAAAGRAALLFRHADGAAHFALRVDAMGTRQTRVFWRVPAAMSRVSGVQAAALAGAPWEPLTAHAILLLDRRWLVERLGRAVHAVPGCDARSAGAPG